jgi:ketosteroid isomerase-like protein
MSISTSDRAVVERLFRAMQAGADGEGEMMALFAPDATFIEPFSGQAIAHSGRNAIRESFRQQTAHPMPDMKLTLDRVDLDGSIVKANWTCTSSAFPAPMRGHDLFTIQNGQITRLEIIVTDMPGMPG